jgi:hypothetical protein
MTVITREYLAALKANVIGDTDTLARIRELLEERDGPCSGEIYGALYSVALATAARRVFPGDYNSATRADIIRFVAQLRSAVAGTEDDFDPRVAEHVLIAMLGGPEDIETLDKEDLAVVIVMLIGGLLAYLGIEESGIDDFLSEVSPLAEGPIRSITSRRSLAGSWILFCAFRNTTPRVPGYFPSSVRMCRYCTSRLSPSSRTSVAQSNPFGAIGCRLNGGLACSSAIFRKSRKVSCSR